MACTGSNLNFVEGNRIVLQGVPFILSLGAAALYRSAGKSLAQPGRKQAAATEDFDFHVSYL
jgi:hypothetical protein